MSITARKIIIALGILIYLAGLLVSFPYRAILFIVGLTIAGYAIIEDKGEKV